MSIHQYNAQWWRLRSLPQLLRRAVWYLKELPDRTVVVLSPVIPFLLLVNEQISLLEGLLLTQVPILLHHLANSNESEEFTPHDRKVPPENPEVTQNRASILKEWQSGVRERLLADAENAKVYAAILTRMNHIPDVGGFTTGMGAQMALEFIAREVRGARLTANCDLGHVLYSFAMGWTEAPVPGTGHGAFTGRKAIRVLRQFPDWPSGWDAQLSRVADSLRPPPTVDRGQEDMTVVQWIVVVTVFVPMLIWYRIEDSFRK